MSLQSLQVRCQNRENPNAYIGLLDEPDVIMRKFKRAVTDSDMSIRYDEKEKAGISNLLSIYSSMTGKAFGEIEREFEGRAMAILRQQSESRWLKTYANTRQI